MIWKGFSLTAVCALALFTPSCAHDRELVDITIHPGVPLSPLLIPAHKCYSRHSAALSIRRKPKTLLTRSHGKRTFPN